MYKIQIILVILFFNFFVISLTAQPQDTIVPQRKNIIKFNLTANSFLDKAILFEYERVLKNNQSFTIQTGYAAIPFSKLIDSAQVETDLKKSGWNVAADYRFYLANENKHGAPRGIYLAPYMSYHYFKNERSLEIKTESGTWEPILLDSKISLFSIGGEIGYQFIIKKRWSIDLILMGPSVTNYYVNMELTGSLPDQELNDNLNQIMTALLDKYPFVGDLLDDNVAQTSGRVNTWDLGFRYSVHIGFCF